MAGGELVEHDSKAEQVGAPVHLAALDLLRRHVRHRADDRLLAGEHRPAVGGRRPAGRVGLQLGEAEVEHLEAPILGEHQVRRLQVPVRDALLMCGRQRTAQGDADLEQLVLGHALLGQQLIQRAPLDPLHGQDVQVADVLDREDRDDVGMVERRQGLGLALEAGQAFRVAGKVGGQDLEHDAALEIQVLSEVDLSHPAFSELGEDRVMRQLLADQR